MKKIIQSPLAPAAIGPYSQAVEKDGLLFLSGQMGIDPATGKMVDESKEAQMEQLFKNIGNVLKEAGYSFEEVIKTTAYIMDMNDFALFNGLYSKHFNKPYPARSVVQVAALPKKEAYVEMELIASR